VTADVLPIPGLLSPAVTDQEGIFVTGTAGGPMDIVDSIMTAGAAAAETAAYLQRHNGHAERAFVAAPEGSVSHA
jgi:heterodisulfide reductase subunit A-like polyferredoxin